MPGFKLNLPYYLLMNDELINEKYLIMFYLIIKNMIGFVLFHLICFLVFSV